MFNIAIWGITNKPLVVDMSFCPKNTSRMVANHYLRHLHQIRVRHAWVSGSIVVLVIEKHAPLIRSFEMFAMVESDRLFKWMFWTVYDLLVYTVNGFDVMK